MPEFVVDPIFFFFCEKFIYFSNLGAYFVVILHKIFVVISKSVFKRIIFKVFLYI